MALARMLVDSVTTGLVFMDLILLRMDCSLNSFSLMVTVNSIVLLDRIQRFIADQ